MEPPAPIIRLPGHPAVLLATRICVTLPFLVGRLVKLAFLEHATIAAAFIPVTVLSFRTQSNRGIS